MTSQFSPKVSEVLAFSREEATPTGQPISWAGTSSFGDAQRKG